jgi:pyruvate,water dikinase
MLSDAQQSSLNEGLAEMNLPEGTLFAVRSSSPEEDLENASFAGAYETVLGVSRDSLEWAVRTCFLSAYDARITTYKKERGIQSVEPKLAVLVQRMINADVAGVAFSLNPLNNCYDEAVINANFGLGESVVSGESEPDQFIVDKHQRVIVGRTCGSKELVIRTGAGGGTIRKTLAHASSFSITDAEALRIADLVSEIEETYQQPVDIEWAMERSKLYLLQVRPITTYHPLPEEMITAPGAPKRLYANSTLIEQGLEKPLSVLGTDFLSYVLRQMTGAMGGDAVILSSLH